MNRFRFSHRRPGKTLRLLFGLLALVLTAGYNSSVCAESPPPVFARLVSLSPLLTENIFLLGAGDRLVGNTIYCQRPEAARTLAKVGSVQEQSVEKIVALRPHLVAASNLTPTAQVDALRRLGLVVEVFQEPSSFADICDHFLRLGRLLGREDRARTIIDQAAGKVAMVRGAVASLPRRKVFLQVGAHPLHSSVKDSFTHDFIELAGGINVAGGLRSGAMKTEQVLALNPDVIIIAVMGTEHGIGAEEKQRWLGFAALEAVRAGRVHVMNPDLVCSPSPATFAETLVAIARLIHPEAAVDTGGAQTGH